MSKASHWYPRYVGDYMKKTQHLSLVEHGAYAVLMDYYYSNNQPLPASADVLHRVCRAFAPDEQAAVQKILAEFFVLREGRYHNDRADQEIQKREKISTCRANAAYAKAAKAGASASAKASASADTTTTTSSTVDKSTSEEGAPKETKRKALAKLKEPDAIIEWEAYRVEHRINCDVLLELEKFTQYCLSGKGNYTNYTAAFRNWLLKRREDTYATNQQRAGGGRGPSKAERIQQAARRGHAKAAGFDAGLEGEGEALGDAPRLL